MIDLATTVDEYLRVRRALGFKLERETRLLPAFVAFLHRHGGASITTDLALRWAMARRTPPRRGGRSAWAWSAPLPATCGRAIRGRKSRRGSSCRPRDPRDSSRTCTLMTMSERC